MVQQGVYISKGILLLIQYRSQEGLNKPMEEKYDHQFEQNNGKENVLKHVYQGYILPKDKQSMISMTGYNVENSLGKEREIS